jgi:hypothetical protein
MELEGVSVDRDVVDDLVDDGLGNPLMHEALN